MNHCVKRECMVGPRGRRFAAALLILLTGTSTGPGGEPKAPAGVRLEEIASIRGPWRTLADIAFSPDGKTFATAGGDGCVRLWDTSTRTQKSVLKGGQARGVHRVAFSPDGTHLAALDEVFGSMENDWEELRVWRLATQTVIASWALEEFTARSKPVFLNTGKLGLVVSGADLKVLQVIEWEWAANKKTVVRTAAGSYGDAILSPNADRLFAYMPDQLAIGKDFGIMAWNLPSGNVRFRLDRISKEAIDLAISPDGSLLISLNVDDPTQLTVWDALTGKRIANATMPGLTRSWAFNPQGGWLAVGGVDLKQGSGTIGIWSIGPSPAILETHNGLQYVIRAIAWSPDGRLVGSVVFDNPGEDPPQPVAIRLWKVVSR